MKQKVYSFIEWLGIPIAPRYNSKRYTIELERIIMAQLVELKKILGKK